MDIICPLLMMLTDNEEADKLAGRFGSYGRGVSRHCRSCDVPLNELGNPDFVCKRIPWEELNNVAMSDDKSLRQAYSVYALDNAFNRINVACPTFGINGIMPPDILHVVKLGPAKRFVKLVCDNLSTRQKSDMDALAIHFHKSHRQSHRKNFPDTDFSRGITNLTQMSANEYMGVLFVFVILSHFTDGWNVLEQAMIRNSATASVEDVVELLEAFLCFIAWLNESSLWPLAEEETYMLFTRVFR